MDGEDLEALVSVSDTALQHVRRSGMLGKAEEAVLTFLDRNLTKKKAIGAFAVFSLLGWSGTSLLNKTLKKLDKKAKKSKKDKGKKEKIAVDKVFVRRLKDFWPILIGKSEKVQMLLIAIILIIRSALDVWVIKNNSDIVGAIVRMDRKLFIRHTVLEFGLMQIPLSFINNSLKHLVSSLSLGMRERFTRHLHKLYLDGNVYFSVTNLDGRTANADHLIVSDVKNLTDSFGHLYTNITKPVLDLVFFFSQICVLFGASGPSAMIAYFGVAGTLMTRLRTRFGALTSQEAELEADFRHTHSRLIAHSEEIAFYGGAKRESIFVNASLSRLVAHIRNYLRFRFSLGLIDSVMTKYSATLLAYFIVSAPIFAKENREKYAGDRNLILTDYTRYVRLLFSMVMAVGRLVDSGRELSHFAGYVHRVHTFVSTLQDIGKGHYERTMVEVRDEEGGATDANGARRFDINDRRGKLVELPEEAPPTISFDRVPLVTPNGDLLVDNVTFEIHAGMNTMVVGPNGCGKSSTFRVLSGLWPVFDGEVRRPGGRNLFYVPQRPYLAIGTLRDQIIYPDDTVRSGLSDDDLLEYLRLVKLEYLTKREGGFDAEQDWEDTLSGGEKQRVAMARLLYWKPQFAILDECTSAVSADVEASMYKKCKELGITLFTISHRKSLWQHHEYLLEFDGRGNYAFGSIHGKEVFGT